MGNPTDRDVEIRLFGSLSILMDGEQIVTLQGRKCRNVLSYLVLRHDVPHAREQLAALFWGDRDAAQARHCFNTALWRLQAALGGKEGPARRWLRSDPQTVRFCPDAAVSVDVIRFEADCALADGVPVAAVEQQAALRRQAIAVYRGDLLLDCYEDWCLAERERLQRLYVRTLRWLVQYHRQRGEFEQAIEDARRILACDPLREAVHRDLIRLYLDSGQPAAALQQYRACVDVLKGELGIAPMPETSLLLQHIMRAGRPAASPPSEPLVAPITEKRPDRPPSPSHDPRRADLEVVLQVCGQLRDIATTLESVARRLAPPGAVPDDSTVAPSLQHEQQQLLVDLPTRLEPMATVLEHVAVSGGSLPRTVNGARAPT
jgi:DNA-binding SARP family transcriptional activator